MKRRKHPEQTLQIQVAEFLALALRPPTVWSAIGHGGGGKVRGAILKSMGVKPGLPDMFVMHPLPRANRGVIVVGIELKAAKGKVSPEQDRMGWDFIRAGAHYPVCRSLEEVEHWLRKFGIPLHASVGTKLPEAA